MADTSIPSPNQNTQSRRFRLGFRRKGPPSLSKRSLSKRDEPALRKQPTTSTQNITTAYPITHLYDDRQRVLERLDAAIKLLEEAIKGHENIWVSLECRELHSHPKEFDDQLLIKINHILELQKAKVQDRSAWEKCRHVVNSFFMIFAPFSKNFLNIAHSSCQIAEKEVARKNEFEATLDYMYQQLGQLKIIDRLPRDLDELECIVNRAMDCRSAFMVYMAMHLTHEATPVGTIGRITKTLFFGDQKITDSEKYLVTAIEKYRAALDTIILSICLRVHDVLNDFTSMNSSRDATVLEDKFIVPYQRNPKFTGREILLRKLKERLLTQVPRQYNHRVAIYGMGGVGKTQCALEYVYSNLDMYERIYWIAATNEASIMSGFQNIAKAAKVSMDQLTSPADVAQAVIKWLRQLNSSWLLVFDNLDDFELLSGLLPENAIDKHTIITTRNPNTRGIPAEPFEIPILDVDEAVGLLSVLSCIEVNADSPERQQAELIVQELGCLALGIEQAAAYIVEVSEDFASYIDTYCRNRTALHRRIPSGNRQYSHSIATTWSMNFDILSKSYPSAVHLLQLFSVLNPDGISIEFLIEGAEGLKNVLGDIVLDEMRRSEALFQLGRFSLIKWDRSTQKIVLHRLLQCVVRDRMSEEEKSFVDDSLVGLCSTIFLGGDGDLHSSICRRCVDQVVGPLLQLNSTFVKAAEVKVRVGEFLRFEGKLMESEKLLLQAIDSLKEILGSFARLTLSAKRNLAETYFEHCQYVEALELLRSVVESSKRVLGDDDPDTLESILLIAVIYRDLQDLKAAKSLGRQIFEKSKIALGEEHPITLRSMYEVSRICRYDGGSRESLELGEAVLTRMRKVHGEGHIRTLWCALSVARTYHQVGRITDAIKLAEEVWNKSRELLGEYHPESLSSSICLSWKYEQNGSATDVARVAENTLEGIQKVYGLEHIYTLLSMSDLADAYTSIGRKEDAVKLMEKTVSISKTSLGKNHIETFRLMTHLAQLYNDHGRLNDAIQLQKEILAQKRIRLPSDHVSVLSSMHTLGYFFHCDGRFEEAAAVEEETLKKRKDTLGLDSDATLCTMQNLAHSYWRLKRFKEAEMLTEEVLQRRKILLGEDHSDTLSSMEWLAGLYSDQGKPLEAEALWNQVIEKRKTVCGLDDKRTLVSLRKVACFYWKQRRTTEGDALMRDVICKMENILGVEHEDTLKSMEYLADSYLDRGQVQDELPLREELLKRKKASAGEDHEDTLYAMGYVGFVYYRQDRVAEAIPLQEDLCTKAVGIFGNETSSDMGWRSTLADYYRAGGRRPEAIAVREDLVERSSRILGEEHEDTQYYLTRLAEIYREEGLCTKAKGIEKRIKAKRRMDSDEDDNKSEQSNSELERIALRELSEQFEKLLAARNSFLDSNDGLVSNDGSIESESGVLSGEDDWL